MNWIRIATKMKGDPRIGLVAAACQERVHGAVGLVCNVLMELPEHARDGALADVPDLILEQWALWPGKPGVFAKAFRAHLCDDAGVVRAWEKHNGAALRRADADLERKRSARNVRTTSARQTADNPPTSARNPRRVRDVSAVDVDVDVSTATATPSGVAVAVPPARAREGDDGGGMIADVRQAIAGVPHAEAVEGALRAAQHPVALAGELLAMRRGMRGPVVKWDVLCRAVHELHVAGSRVTAASLRAFTRRLLEPEPERTGEASAAEWDALIERANQIPDEQVSA